MTAAWSPYNRSRKWTWKILISSMSQGANKQFLRNLTWCDKIGNALGRSASSSASESNHHKFRQICILNYSSLCLPALCRLLTITKSETVKRVFGLLRYRREHYEIASEKSKSRWTAYYCIKVKESKRRLSALIQLHLSWRPSAFSSMFKHSSRLSYIKTYH